MSVATQHPLAGRTVIVIHSQEFNGLEYIVEDYWQNIAGKSWMDGTGVPGCLDYAIRSAFDGMPTDDDVVYGKIQGMGKLLHVSQLGDVVE